MTIKGSFINSVPEMAVFRKFKGQKYKIATKFCMPGAVQDVITPANFCEDQLRGFGVARGRILAFSIDLLRRL